MLLIDIHEPEIGRVLIGQSIPTEVTSLVDTGFGDYKWSNYEGNIVHVERKQYGEILSDMNGVEHQLQNHMTKQPDARLILIVEGMIVPSMLGIDTLKATNKNNVWVKGYSTSISIGQLYSWFYQISKYIEIFYTTSYEATCGAIVAMVKSDQKESHNTLTRYFKPLVFRENPQITGAMGLWPGMGEVRASALIDRFATVYNIMVASPEEIASVPGIGIKLATEWLRRVGRWDV